ITLGPRTRPPCPSYACNNSGRLHRFEVPVRLDRKPWTADFWARAAFFRRFNDTRRETIRSPVQKKPRTLREARSRATPDLTSSGSTPITFGEDLTSFASASGGLTSDLASPALEHGRRGPELPRRRPDSKARRNAQFVGQLQRAVTHPRCVEVSRKLDRR